MGSFGSYSSFLLLQVSPEPEGVPVESPQQKKPKVHWRDLRKKRAAAKAQIIEKPITKVNELVSMAWVGMFVTSCMAGAQENMDAIWKEAAIYNNLRRQGNQLYDIMVFLFSAHCIIMLLCSLGHLARRRMLIPRATTHH